MPNNYTYFNQNSHSRLKKYKILIEMTDVAAENLKILQKINTTPIQTRTYFMSEFKILQNNQGLITNIETSLKGHDLLATAKLNKGCAFTYEERKCFDLEGLLPHQVETLDQQVARMYAQYNEHRSNLSKNIYLNVLHDYNETLFYKLVSQYLEEMLPIIYTPTVGEAVERFSLEHRKTRGLYISYPEVNNIEKILDQHLPPNTALITVTDGEGVLGLGDQGIGGINIVSAKLMVYTLCGGISPYLVLPIQLDVGTNNPKLLSDPMYLGWRHERIVGKEYDNFIDRFVTALIKRIPNIYVHWEDLGRANARNILNRYRDHICTINGDMQSTGVVALATVLAGVMASGIKLQDHRIVILGGGTAGLGIAEQLSGALQQEGLSSQDACKNILIVDKEGLVLQENPATLAFQKPFAISKKSIADWKLQKSGVISFYDVIKNYKPTILIGCSTAKGAFTEEIVKTMAANTPLPIIMPLSNPTAYSEANPEDLLKWTQGKALIATGSPFPEVNFHDHIVRFAQCNNAFAFPGIGLGTIAVQAKRLSDGMLWAAVQALGQCSPVLQDRTAPLLPKFSETRSISRQIALAVALQARREGLAQINEKIDLNMALNQVSWEPKYYPYKKI